MNPTHRDIVISPQHILEQLKTTQKRKAPGHDSITYEHITKMAPHIVYQLADIYTASLDYGVVPWQWKHGKLVILKKPSKPDDQPSSYRPITLLPTFGKLLEQCVKPHLENQRNLHPQQYAYQKGKSAEDAIHSVINFISSSDHLYPITLFIDIKGAFDNMWHPHLLAELRRHQINPKLYTWVKNYLTDRHVSLHDPDATHN